MLYYLPIAIIVLSNVFYHMASKKVPDNTNPFFFVMVSYVVGMVVAFVAFTMSKGDMSLSQAFSEQRKLINWTPMILGISVIGLEVGNVMMYRAGWDVSKGAMYSNMLLALVLFGVGYWFFKDLVDIRQIAGMFLCIAGLYLLS